MNYLDLAINPKQYDSNELDWTHEGDVDSVSRKYFQDHLMSVLPNNLQQKKVLDIGCGVGQLFPLLKSLGATDISGLDPSSNNITTASTVYPEVKLIEKPLFDYESSELFDVCIAIMVFEHILDTQRAFDKINSFLNIGGEFYLIIGDKNYHTSPRPTIISYDVQDIGNDIVATQTVRESGVMYDVFRPIENIISDANKGGFNIELHKELPARVQVDPSRPVVACHLLVFKKVK